MTDNKNILIISPFFYPEPISTGKFNTNFATELAKKGHNVTVLCFHPFYPNWKVKKSNETLKNIKIVRGGSRIYFTKKTILQRLILEVSFAFFVLRKGVKYQKNKDLIIPVFPPSFAFYCLLPLLKKSTKTVGMVHDLQEVYSERKKGLINKLIRFFIHRVEHKCYSACDKLLFLSNEMKKEAQRLYHLPEIKLEVQYPFITIKEEFSNDLGLILDQKKINIVYSGALGEKQNPNQLYDFFSKTSKQINNSRFHFFSEGDTFNKLKNKNKNKNILFHPLVDKKNLEELYRKSTIQVIPQKENTSKGSLPSKLPNLLASGTKVLVITDPNSEIDNLFKNNNLSLIASNWDIDYLIKKINTLLEKEINKKDQIAIANKLFTIDKMILKLFR